MKETVGGTDTMYEYDAYGRLTRKYQGDPGNPTYVSGYEWRYSDKLAGYLSNFPGESGAVTYDYGGDGKRRKRTEGGNTTTYYWDAGWNQINYKTQSGSKFTWVRDPASAGTRLLAKWNGTNPSTAIWRYYSQDNIGSTRMGTNDGKTTIKTYDYTPYGEIYSESGWAHTNFRFTGAFSDGTTRMYYFPFRNYSPGVGRWISRDPMGMVDGPNVYSYVASNPVRNYDRLGLVTVRGCGCGNLGHLVNRAISRLRANVAAGCLGGSQTLKKCVQSRLAPGSNLSVECTTCRIESFIRGEKTRGYTTTPGYIGQEWFRRKRPAAAICTENVRDITTTLMHEILHTCGMYDAPGGMLANIGTYAAGCR